MSDKTSIEWTDATWNPIRAENGRHICATISPGCDHCYASTMTHRFTGQAYGPEGQPLTSKPVLDRVALDLPLHWKQPRKIFVGSMTDIFGSWVSEQWLDEIFSVMRQAPQHTYQLLTKRPARMVEYVRTWHAGLPQPAQRAPSGWPRNIWLGTTVESAAYAWRASTLSQVKDFADAVLFISAEPLLSAVELTPHMLGACPEHDGPGTACGMSDNGWCSSRPRLINWVIGGGESGPHARPMHPDWARWLRDQCQAAGVAFFFKQWGEWWPSGPRVVESARMIDFGGEIMYRVGTHKAGRLLDGQEHSAFPGDAVKSEE